MKFESQGTVQNLHSAFFHVRKGVKDAAGNCTDSNGLGKAGNAEYVRLFCKIQPMAPCRRYRAPVVFARLNSTGASQNPHTAARKYPHARARPHSGSFLPQHSRSASEPPESGSLNST